MNELENKMNSSYVNNVSNETNDIESVSANTEDSLITTRSNSETDSISKGKSNRFICCGKKCCSYCGLLTGILLTILGILMLIWTPFTVFMDERMKMLPGLPPFEWWRIPPDEVLLKAYVFNVTNSEEFLSGKHDKLNLQEIGPIIYLEKLTHTNVVFNDNSTLTYTANRTAIYLPEENQIDYLNSTIIIPNYAVLGMASFLYDSSFVTKIGFNMLLRGVQSPLFVKTTVYNFLWNYTDPILNVARKFAPSIVPSENMGMLNMIYRDFADNSTVYIGSKFGYERFFLMDRYDGSEYLPGHGSSCSDLVVNSTEGVLYPEFIQKNATLNYWRKTLCRLIHLNFEEERFIEEYEVNAYKFVINPGSYDRKDDLNKDCYKGEPILPSGLSDVSKCYNGIPMAASFPHFLYGSPDLQEYVTGLKPNHEDHDSYIFVEPLTGVPITGKARSQSNMIIRDMSGFTSDVQLFHNKVLPMFWLEYHQVGLPNYVKLLMLITVNTIPKYQHYFSCSLIIISLLVVILKLRQILNRNKSHNYKKNTDLHFEQETFLKQNSNQSNN